MKNAVCSIVVVVLLTLAAVVAPTPSHALTVGGSSPWGPVNVTVGPLIVNGNQVFMRQSAMIQGSTTAFYAECLAVAADHGGTPFGVPTQTIAAYFLGPHGIGDFNTCWQYLPAGSCFSVSGVFLDLPDENGMTTVVNSLGPCVH